MALAIGLDDRLQARESLTRLLFTAASLAFPEAQSQCGPFPVLTLGTYGESCGARKSDLERQRDMPRGHWAPPLRLSKEPGSPVAARRGRP